MRLRFLAYGNGGEKNGDEEKMSLPIHHIYRAINSEQVVLSTLRKATLYPFPLMNNLRGDMYYLQRQKEVSRGMGGRKHDFASIRNYLNFPDS